MGSRRLSRLQNVASTKLLRRLDAVCMGLKKEDCCAMSDHFYMSFVQVSFVLGDYNQFIPLYFRKYIR